VRAVYCKNRIVTIIFGFLLLAVTGVYLMVPIGIRATHIPGTERCIELPEKTYYAAPGLVNAGYDTLVFIAISFRILSFSLAGENLSSRARSFFRGDGLTHLSQSLLKGGQLYYLYVLLSPSLSTC
jgi:hypothetical protein